MEISKNNKKALAELYVIILNMSEELQEKIPVSLKQNIAIHMDKLHYYDEETEIMPETKVLLYEIISKYLADKELKEKIKEYDKFTIEKIKQFKSENGLLKKKNEYENVSYVSNKDESNALNISETEVFVEENKSEQQEKLNNAIIKEEKGFFSKIIKKLQSLLKNNKKM